MADRENITTAALERLYGKKILKTQSLILVAEGMFVREDEVWWRRLEEHS